MSKDLNSAFSLQFSSEFRAQPTPYVLQKSAVLPGQAACPSSVTALQQGSVTEKELGKWLTNGQPNPVKALGVTYRTPEELEISRKVAANFSSRLAADSAAVLQPDIDAPFIDTIDVINRLFPYHVFQHPEDDLKWVIKGDKGKQKAVEEAEETKFALECFKRYRALRKRFRRAKVKSGQHASPSDQAYVLAQSVLEADRQDITRLNTELREARAELDKIERDKRAATSTPAHSVYYNPPQIPPGAHAQYYRPYPYVYVQPYGANPMTNNYSSSSTTTPALASSMPAPAIPIQLPVNSLSALHALGIIPVTANTVTPAGQPPPAAILRGVSANGSMLNMEINVSQLQPSQMSGLAIILNSLMARASASTTSTTSSESSSKEAPVPTPNGVLDGG